MSNISRLIPEAIQRTRAVTIHNGQGSLRFNLKISPHATIALSRARRLLQDISSEFARAPYYQKLLKKGPFNVWIITKKEFTERTGAASNQSLSLDDFLYSSVEALAPKVPAASFDPLSNAIFVRCETAESPQARHILKHEILHAASTKVEEKNDSFVVRTGLDIIDINKDDLTAADSFKKMINEGITEYLLRFTRGGNINFGVYGDLADIIALLAHKLGDNALFDWYFNNKIDQFEAALESLYGKKAAVELRVLADFLKEPRAIPENIKWTLERFVNYGFESNVMREWGYSPENRSRAPREITAQIQKWPEQLAEPLLETGMRVFTNCTAEELEQYLMHFNETGFYRFISIHPDNFAHTVRGNVRYHSKYGDKCLLFIRFYKAGEILGPSGFEGRKGMNFRIARIKIDLLTQPHFLGRADLGENLFDFFPPQT